jgi:hypothetical protein
VGADRKERRGRDREAQEGKSRLRYRLKKVETPWQYIESQEGREVHVYYILYIIYYNNILLLNGF